MGRKFNTLTENTARMNARKIPFEGSILHFNSS